MYNLLKINPCFTTIGNFTSIKYKSLILHLKKTIWKTFWREWKVFNHNLIFLFDGVPVVLRIEDCCNRYEARFKKTSGAATRPLGQSAQEWVHPPSPVAGYVVFVFPLRRDISYHKQFSNLFIFLPRRQLYIEMNTQYSWHSNLSSLNLNQYFNIMLPRKLPPCIF